MILENPAFASTSTSPGTLSQTDRYLRGMELLVSVVQQLSLARDLPSIIEIVRHAARQLTGADGATFVLREREHCFYADEDAIAPLWKGKRFPLSACISGWAMLNRQPTVIEDIYADGRIPHDAYRPTFVKSLAMVPIRTLEPIGAIGNYWATPYRPSDSEVRLLQALADTTAVAMENVQIYNELEQRVKDRTAELQASNRELEAFSMAISHDLRAPIRHILGFAGILREEAGNTLNDSGKASLEQIRTSATRMSQLVDDLLGLSRTTQITLQRKQFNLGDTAREVLAALQAAQPARQAEISIEGGMEINADPRLVRVVLENLLSNAWKFTGKRAVSRIALNSTRLDNGETVYSVRDNGAGFDMAYADRLFGVFQRMHSDDAFPGTGVGLATVQRIIKKHGGRIWAESEVEVGTTFCFTLE